MKRIERSASLGFLTCFLPSFASFLQALVVSADVVCNYILYIQIYRIYVQGQTYESLPPTILTSEYGRIHATKGWIDYSLFAVV